MPAPFLAFSIEAPAATSYDLGEIDGFTGSIGGLSLLGATLILGGWSFGVEGGSHGCLFESAPAGATFEAELIPASETSGDVTPFPEPSSGSIGVLGFYAETLLLGGLDTELILGSVNSCLFPVEAPEIPINPTVGSGGGRTIWRCPNIWDGCVLGERKLLERIDWGARLRFAPGDGCVASCAPWIRPPGNAVTFRPFTVAALPAVEQVDTLILETDVPAGMAGVMQGLLLQFTGSGYSTASGDIIWRIRNGPRWIKNYSDISIALGDLAGFYPMDGGGERIYSLQRIRVYANLAAGALNRLNPEGKLLTGLDGYLYPEASWRIDK